MQDLHTKDLDAVAERAISWKRPSSHSLADDYFYTSTLRKACQVFRRHDQRPIQIARRNVVNVDVEHH